MKLAIMQPYLFPYIGYFQLMNEVDEFVIYDNIEFTKKGWINRNRILVEGKDAYISFPLKKDSDFLEVKERFLAESWTVERQKMLNRIKESYRKAPYFNVVFPLVEKLILFENINLFSFILNTINTLKALFGIKSSIIVSSSIQIDHTLKAEKKVIAICKARQATTYINSVGGLELYSRDVFQKEGIELKFLKTGNISYPQYQFDFTPGLSIVDVMMFNSNEKIQEYLNTSFSFV
jgi:WbqC-like protein family